MVETPSPEIPLDEISILVDSLTDRLKSIPLDSGTRFDDSEEPVTELLDTPDLSLVHSEITGDYQLVIDNLPQEDLERLEKEHKHVKSDRASVIVNKDGLKLDFTENQVVLGAAGFSLGSTEFTVNNQARSVTKRYGKPTHEPLTPEDENYLKSTLQFAVDHFPSKILES